MREGIWVPNLVHRSGETFWGKAAQNRKDMVPKEAISILEAQVNRVIIKKLIDSVPVPELPKKKTRRASAVKTETEKKTRRASAVKSETESVRKNSCVCNFIKDYEFLPVYLPRLFIICTSFSCFAHLCGHQKNILWSLFQGHMMTPLSPILHPIIILPPLPPVNLHALKRKNTSTIMNLLMIR